VLNIAALGDHVVPLEAARALNRRISSADQDLWELPGGHLGAVVSRAATRKLWPRLDAWLAERAG
jgi:polyhydroxyalkanoate synthase